MAYARARFDISSDGTDVSENLSDAADQRNITVKFRIEENRVFTQSYHEDTAIGDLKTLLVNVFNVSASSMVLRVEETELSDEMVLRDLGTATFGVLELKLSSKNSEDRLTVDEAYREYYAVPDVITVRVQTSDEGIKDVVVEVENRAIVKPFLGGYLDKHSGIEYHHGYTQTGPPKPKVPPEMKSHRDTQTYFMRNRKLDVPYAHATQMANEELWIPCVSDKILTAGPYETAEEREKRLDVEGKVRIIQRYFRAWLMKKRLKDYHDEYWKRMNLMKEREELEKKEDMERKKRDLISRVFPRTAADFSMLYAMTERWKKAEIKRIVEMHCGPARIAEFYLLLEKEIEILRSIEALRIKLKNDRKIQKELDFFKTIGEPWTFKSSYKNIPVTIDTLETQKGRTYRELYEAVCDRSLDSSNRMLVLLELKRGFETHNCEISNEMIELINRACELLARGFTGKDIETLQKRIEALLLHHFQLPECNEGVTDRYNRLTEKSMKENLFYCQNCQKLKPLESYNIGVKTPAAKICATCKFIDKSKEPWIDISPYRFILRQIRKTERLLHAPSSIAFIIQDKDIYYIVTHIWHGHSALSECDNIYQLRLCRWDKKKDWSPWNCILLTAEEAKCHLKIENLEDVYDENFLSHVFNKHALTKKYFAHSFDIAKCIKETEVDDEYVDHYSEMKKFGTNLRECIGAWNLGTNRWLRMVVYERVEKNSMVLTYALSALWHGFYPGYYLTFANGAFFTLASRTMRKTVRNYFLANAETKFFYDAITFVTTRILMAYMVFTFILLEFWPCIRVYMHMYWCLHLCGLVAILVVPKVIPKTEAGQVPKNPITQAFVPITNGVSRHHD